MIIMGAIFLREECNDAVKDIFSQRETESVQASIWQESGREWTAQHNLIWLRLLVALRG